MKTFPTGIPDPCPDFTSAILPLRQQRLAARVAAEKNRTPSLCRVLFMSHCIPEKGLFIALEAVRQANEKLRQQNSNIRFSMDVFGSFIWEKDKRLFECFFEHTDWQDESWGALLRYREDVRGAEKESVFVNSDILCFPSYYPAEVIPTVILDALAYGLPVVTTDWRGIPELLPENALAVCQVQKTEDVVSRLMQALWVDNFSVYRKKFEKDFLLHKFLFRMHETLSYEGKLRK